MFIYIKGEIIMKVQISAQKYMEIVKSGMKVAKIIGIQWEKAESQAYYYKNYKTWGYTSTPTRLYVFYEKENGSIQKKDIYNFILKTMGWKKMSDKREESLRKFLVGKTITANSLMMKAY